MVIDAIEPKLYRKPPVRYKKYPENIWRIYISNKAVELINYFSTLTKT